MQIKPRLPSPVRMHLRTIYEADASQNRMPAMEGLRGLAILLVFLCHYDLVVLSRLSPTYGSLFFRVVVQIGGTGVDLFFLLSGMLIYKAALRRDLRFRRFLARRVQRIYPTFLAAFSIYFVASVLLHQGERRVPDTLSAGARYVASNLLLLPGLADMKPLIPAAWSLSYEFCFYITIPFFTLVLRMYSWSRLQRSLTWIAVLSLHLSYVVMLPSTLPKYQYQNNTFLRFSMFLAGMLVYELLSSARGAGWLTSRRQPWLALLGALCATEYCLLLARDVDRSYASMTHAAVSALLVFLIYSSLTLATLGEAGIWKQLFSRAWLRWTGNISYSLYLIHGIVLNVVIALALHLPAVRLHPEWSGVLLMPICFAVTFAAATLLFVAVEKPFSLNTGKSYPAPQAHTAVEAV